jgi:hypothetical protein
MPDSTHVFPVIFEIVIFPENALAAAIPIVAKKPVELLCELTPVPPPDALPTYPVATILPEPICNRIGLTPFVLTPLSITVILLAVAGMPVKVTLVPDADTEEPDTKGYSVPVGDVTVPANVAFCDASNVSAVVPAPVPVLISSMPVLSAEKANPFVALPAVIVVAIINP